MTTDPDAPRVCANPRCTEPDPDQRGQTRRTPTLRTFCDGCERRIARLLAELPTVYAALHVALTPTGGEGEKVSGSKAAPLPLREDVAALIDDIERTVTTLEDGLRRAWGWTAKTPPAGGRGVRVQASCRWLLAAVTPLLASPAGGDHGVALLELEARASRALGTSRPETIRLSAPCPACDLLSLARRNGGDRVRCTNPRCRSSWSEDEYERLVRIWTSDEATRQRFTSARRERGHG